MSILLISHDLENITHWTNTITVMYSGQFVEAGTTQQIFTKPRHPYTKALVDSSPQANLQLPAKSRLMALPGRLKSVIFGCVGSNPTSGTRRRTRREEKERREERERKKEKKQSNRIDVGPTTY
eukprot:TRINITY_DN3214_c0_g1_i1.p1 TRINITY_DN3214_c0_g1~~TRINITY_DN3214_c0_g1_i1.p1  ORF type:complete len:124 (-),score=6.81 TRINITY_DN3214_c0_g1_i1:39-410(-)